MAFKELTKLLTSSAAIPLIDIIILSAEKKDEKPLAQQLVHVFEAAGRGEEGGGEEGDGGKCVEEFLEHLVMRSVGGCAGGGGSVLRGNGVTEKAITAYCYMVGRDYLGRCLKPLFLSVMNSTCGYEIDPRLVFNIL